MSTTYAASTEVSAGKSRDEIERTLSRYGATQFAYAWDEQASMVGFVTAGRQIRFVLPMPNRNAREFTHTPSKNQRRGPEAQATAYEQAVRSRWRNLALVIKAKMAAVESGIVTFEQEFAMHMVLPDGMTVAEHVLPAIESAYAEGVVPPLLGPVSTRPQLPGRRIEEDR